MIVTGSAIDLLTITAGIEFDQMDGGDRCALADALERSRRTRLLSRVEKRMWSVLGIM